VASELAENGR